MVALAQIIREDVIALLTEMYQTGGNTELQQSAIILLIELEELSAMLQDSDVSRQWVALQMLATIDDSVIQESVLANVPATRRILYDLVLEQLGDPQPGAGIVVRDGYWLPDIVWGKEVPTGDYTIGGDPDAYRSFDERKVAISRAYQLSSYPVTYIQFQCFIAASDFANERWWAGMPEEERAYGTLPATQLSEQGSNSGTTHANG